jgi:ABC-type Zn uptake system ZnuABC Zn-binding protein ZnuA
LFYYTPVWNYILREYFLEQYYLQFGENADSPTHEMYKELEDVIDHHAILGGKVIKFRDKVQGVLDSKKYMYKIIVKTDIPHTDLDFKMLINCNHVEVQEIKRV